MFIAAIGLAAPAQFVVTTPAQAEAGGYNGFPSYCKGYVGSGEDPNLNRGECITLLTNQWHYFHDDGRNANAYSVKACDYFAENYPDIYDSLWSSKQDCMSEYLTTP